MYKLKLRDLLKGLLVSVITSVLVVIQSSLEMGNLTFNWKNIGMVAAGSAVAYLLKNFFTNDVKVAEKVLEEEAKVKAAAPNDKEINP